MGESYVRSQNFLNQTLGKDVSFFGGGANLLTPQWFEMQKF